MTNQETPQRMLTAQETALRLGIHPKTLYREWREWGLTAYRVGNGLKFREADVNAWIERHTA
jgi:excisionase family DNA binding protein